MAASNIVLSFRASGIPIMFVILLYRCCIYRWHSCTISSVVLKRCAKVSIFSPICGPKYKSLGGDLPPHASGAVAMNHGLLHGPPSILSVVPVLIDELKSGALRPAVLPRAPEAAQHPGVTHGLPVPMKPGSMPPRGPRPPIWPSRGGPGLHGAAVPANLGPAAAATAAI